MDEAEWNHCTEPDSLLAYVNVRGTADLRKLRLFTASVCQRVRPLLAKEHAQKCGQLPDVLERLADGRARDREWQAALSRARSASLDAAHSIAHPGEVEYYVMASAAEALQHADKPQYAGHAAARAAGYAALARTPDAAVQVISARWANEQWLGRFQWQHDEEAVTRTPTYAAAYAQERGLQADLLRDVFGTPFRPPALSEALRTWKGGTILTTAQRLYDRREFEFLPFVAELLQEAGCDEAELLDHLRSPGPHLRGCWALDLIMGKS